MVAALQPVSWQRMSDAVAKVRERLLRAAHVLDEAGVPYAVVGGNAVAAWVSRVDESAVRNTRDVDLLLRRADLAAATAALGKAGFVHRRVASIGKSGHMDVFLDGADAKVRDALHIVFASEKILPDSIAANADVTESEDSGDFRLIQLEALVRMKLTAWRDKDRVHLRDLADVGLIDESWPDRYSGELAERLQAVLNSPEG
ncbi:MAG: hypothetical protein JWR15_999 [Prosthecobacter sp.]|nr:hypothetical protein [Prosthecobacter sp.]